MPRLTRSALFRADGSTTQGAGHVMRGIGLARALADGGVTTVFVLGDAPGVESLVGVVRAHGHAVEVIAARTPEADAEQTLAIARGHGAPLVVTDLCTADRRGHPEALSVYHGALKATPHAPFLLTIDDASGIPYASDVVVVPYFNPGYLPAPVRPGQVVLAGPEYFVFRPEFVAAAARAATRRIAPAGRNLLVTIGGSDPYGVTARVARAVATLEPGTVRSRFVLGPAFADATVREVEAVLREWPGEVDVLVAPGDVAALMLWADLAITGEGLTKYETAVTGTPSLMVSQFDTDGALVRRFEAAGTTRHLGNAVEFDEASIAKAILDLLGDAAARRAMSERGRALVDGRGAERILARLPKDVWTT